MAGRKSTATMELAIGATIIAAVIVLIVMLMAWGNSTSFLGRHYRVVVNMSNVGGLKEGAPVKMGGFQIGRVASIQIRPGGTDMEIVLDIDEERILPRGSVAKVSTAGLVGDAFMEIIPGKSSETIRRAATIADAERLDSAPLPDMGELLTRVNDFGDELTVLTGHLNDIVGDNEFRRSIKSMAVNMDAVSYQANLILQRSQAVMDNVEVAIANIATLSGTLQERVDDATRDLTEVTANFKEIAQTAKGTMTNIDQGVADARESLRLLTGDANRAITNLDGGISDIRNAVNTTIGDKDFAANLRKTMGNVTEITSDLVARREAIDGLFENFGGLSGDLRLIGTRVREVTDRVDPAVVTETLASVTVAIQSLTDVVDKIKAEPVLALSVNKAADRIVKMKFDEMSKQPQFKNSDAVLDEINRWMRDAMRRGYLHDPSFNHERRPYVMDGR